MYNIPVLKTLKQRPWSFRGTKREQKKKQSQGIRCLCYARHSADFTRHTKQFVNNTQLPNHRNTQSTLLRDSTRLNLSSSALKPEKPHCTRELSWIGSLS